MISDGSFEPVLYRGVQAVFWQMLSPSDSSSWMAVAISSGMFLCLSGTDERASFEEGTDWLC